MQALQDRGTAHHNPPPHAHESAVAVTVTASLALPEPLAGGAEVAMLVLLLVSFLFGNEGSEIEGGEAYSRQDVWRQLHRPASLSVRPAASSTPD